MGIRRLIPGVIRKRVERALGRSVKARPIDFGPALLLSEAPPVFLSGIPYREYLGIAGAFARRYGNVRAGFVIFPTWSIERRGFPEGIRESCLRHLERYPSHIFRFIANTHKETELLKDVGLPALFLNQNFTVSDRVFRPLQGAEVEFDAVYNARFMPEKRHELAAAVPRVGYISYIDREKGRQEQFRRLYAAALARNPGHVLLNDTVDGLTVPMSHEEVNAGLGRAAVGLLLSEEEGASYASMVSAGGASGGQHALKGRPRCLLRP
jgi:hypothetical protein